jgi:hypothetical protein
MYTNDPNIETARAGAVPHLSGSVVVKPADVEIGRCPAVRVRLMATHQRCPLEFKISENSTPECHGPRHLVQSSPKPLGADLDADADATRGTQTRGGSTTVADDWRCAARGLSVLLTASAGAARQVAVA